jgi:hypothetical protein
MAYAIDSPIGLPWFSLAYSAWRALIEPDFEPKFWESASFSAVAAKAPSRLGTVRSLHACSGEAFCICRSAESFTRHFQHIPN